MFRLAYWLNGVYRPIAAVISANLPLPHILYGVEITSQLSSESTRMCMSAWHWDSPPWSCGVLAPLFEPNGLSLLTSDMVQTSMGPTLHNLRTLRMPSLALFRIKVYGRRELQAPSWFSLVPVDHRWNLSGLMEAGNTVVTRRPAIDIRCSAPEHVDNTLKSEFT